jgi:hypothetical protein
MLDLEFQIEGVQAIPYAATPQLAFKLRITQLPAEQSPAIHNVLLRCQVRIEPAQRRYQPDEQQGLHELFGEPHRWGQTLRSMLWTNTVTSVPAFADDTLIDLILPCTYDFNVAATKYFAALEAGDVPLTFLFSGTIFYAGADLALQTSQISWEKEAAFRLPVSVWKQMMELYYPNTAWLCLRKDLFDRLTAFKNDNAIATWDQAIERLLNESTSSSEVTR